MTSTPRVILAVLLLAGGTVTSNLNAQTPASPTDPRGGWEEGSFFLESADGRFRMTLGGRVQPRYQFRDPAEGESTSSFFLRRLRLDIQGQVLDERLTFRLMPELARTANLRDGWVDFAVRPEIRIRAGQQVVPFQWHRFVSGNRQHFAERSRSSETFGFPNGYDVGVMVHGRGSANRFAYGVGLFDGAGRNVAESNSSGNLASARITRALLGILPREEPDLSHSETLQLTVGLGIQGAARSEVRGWDLNRSPVGNTRADWVAATGDISFRWRGLSGYGEAYGRWVSPVDPTVDDWRLALPEDRRRRVRAWLWTGAGLTFLILVVGGITRLTQSGLSIVDWNPIMGAVPPLNEAQWMEAFDRYRQFPEYQKLRQGMTLDEFRFIFFWEYLHRQIARLIGLVFLLPFLFFLVRGYFNGPLLRRSLLLFALGGLQGAIGWYMVSSGLIDRPHVSQFRLGVHLSIAFAIFAGCVWTALDLRVRSPRPSHAADTDGWLRRALVAVGLLFGVQVFWGALVAGLKAGRYFNTFPLMDGGWIPPNMFGLEPALLNFVENPFTVQWTHRVLGTSLRWDDPSWCLQGAPDVVDEEPRAEREGYGPSSVEDHPGTGEQADREPARHEGSRPPGFPPRRGPWPGGDFEGRSR
jgi:heme a synthase